MVALKTKDGSDKQFPVLRAQPDEASVEAVRIAQERERIKPQHLDRRFEENLAGEEEGEGQDFPD